MIRIQKGQTKAVYLTLKEKSTLNSPYYIFELTSNDTDNSLLFTATDFTNNIDRYNVFTFSEGSSATMSGGFSASVGTYDYKVYESQYNVLNIASASSVVEIGLLELYGTVSNFSPVYTDVDDDTEYVYNP